MPVRSLSALLAVLLLAPAGWAAEPVRGLILRIESGGAADARQARSVALYVPSGEPVSPFLEPGPFKATWTGALVLEKRSRLVFTLEGTGRARLLVDGEVLIDAIGKSNESIRLRSGEHQIVCEYESPAEGDAQLRLFWQGRDFGREPVPATVLQHDPADEELAARMKVRYGRRLLAERRCASCHQGSGSRDGETGVPPVRTGETPVSHSMPELLLKGPSLDGVGERLRQDWLAKWIAEPGALRPSAHMPAVFKENAEQSAADIAAYLCEDVADAELQLLATPAQIKRGGEVFHEQGCIACHTLDAQGAGERIGLKSVGSKYRLGALADFLRAPAKFHEATRMPTFDLAEGEATSLAGYLRSLGNDPGAVIPEGDVDRGRQLVVGSGCLNCHQRTGETSSLMVSTPLIDLKGADCGAVRYQFPDEGRDKEALAAFLTAPSGHRSLGRAVEAEFAERQFESLRCVACHSRDGEGTLREQFAEEVAPLKPAPAAVDEAHPAIVSGPPPLNHLGLKLRPEWREKLFAGEIDPKVRRWMPARMPAYPSRAKALAVGFSHAAGVAADSPALAGRDQAKVKIGAAMTGTDGGLACGTCHGIGDQPPIAVFEGEGPNFRDSGARLTREYFHLWMNDPPRLWPGTIMPKYATDGKTPLTQFYDGDATKQFDAIYEYLLSLSGSEN